MTNAFLHSLNIGTLSAWLSIAGFGTVGVVVHPWEPPFKSPSPGEETDLLPEDFDLSDAPFTPDPADASVPSPAPQAIVPVPIEAPPELAPITETEPLPEIPELPEIAPAPAPETTTRETPSRSAAESTPRVSTPSRSGSAGKPAGSSAAQGGSPNSSGSAATMSNAARLAAGRMPAPNYPSAARRGGQTGTVLVEFTVDTTGKVISAHAKKPSPWPILNEEAVRTVRRWKFPPGGVMKLQRPIIFQLR